MAPNCATIVVTEEEPMAPLDIDERTASELIEAAIAEGASVESLLQSLREITENQEGADASPWREAKQPISAEQFLTEVEELSFDGPTLPVDFGRADIYNEHDECAV